MTKNIVQTIINEGEVTMSTPPTLLVEIAFKLGITRPGEDKEKLVEKVNKKIIQHRQLHGMLKRA